MQYSNNDIKTLSSNPELFKFREGDTVYYLNFVHNTGKYNIFSGVIIGGIVDVGHPQYTVNNDNLYENKLFATYDEAKAKILIKTSTDYVNEVNELFDSLFDNNQLLAELVYTYNTALEANESITIISTVAENEKVAYDCKVYKCDTLFIEYVPSRDRYDFYFGVENENVRVDAKHSVCKEFTQIRINLILKSYINRFILKDNTYTDDVD